MYGQFDLITLIALIVAVAAIIKLRSVLGHRTDEDEQRVERLKRANARRDSAAAAEAPRRMSFLCRGAIVNRCLRRLCRRFRDRASKRASGLIPCKILPLQTVLLDIAKLDPSLEPDSFLAGAGRAYETIVSAFAEGNRRALKDLLSKEVYDGFTAAIAEREARGETIDQQFVGIKKAEIIRSRGQERLAYVTVRFVSELISATHDKAGQVIAGDAQKIKDVTDIWTFSRDISTAKARSNPNWRLVATQAPN